MPHHSRFQACVRSVPGWLTVAVALGFALEAAVCGTGISPAPLPEPEIAPPRLFSPTLGQPVFVEPGSSFQIVARAPATTESLELGLCCREWPEQRYRLECAADAAVRLAAGDPLPVRVPANVPRRTYDLEIHADDTRLIGRHCVTVGHVGRALRLVHLANMNVGDPGAPGFDQPLVDEVNLVAPTLIVATGDYLDATHPDPPAGWQELVDYVTRFEAPIVMACGDHDDIELYSRHVAPSPIGLVGIGRHRCLVLLDHSLAPIDVDSDQLRWVERALAQPGFDGMTFVVTHDEAPNLLRYWRRQETLERMIRAGRVGLWFAGGHRDWDGCVYHDLIAAAAPMQYVRTHQSSTAPREGAKGISHYRIIDVVDDRVILPAATVDQTGSPPSTPVGHLSVTFDAPNDGSQRQLGFQAVNNLPYRLNELAVRLRLRKVDRHTLWCQGARLEEVVDVGSMWECRVRFDLPDKGSLRAVAGSGSPPLARPAIDVRFEAPHTFRFRRQVSPDGLPFCTLTNDSPLVHVQNIGDEPVETSPLARLDGDPIAYRPLGEDTRFATAYRLHLRPHEAISLQLDLSAVRVVAGRRELQVYLNGGRVVAPFCHALDVVVDE